MTIGEVFITACLLCAGRTPALPGFNIIPKKAKNQSSLIASLLEDTLEGL
jgi:hypothetical protein